MDYDNPQFASAVKKILHKTIAPLVQEEKVDSSKRTEDPESANSDSGQKLISDDGGNGEPYDEGPGRYEYKPQNNPEPVFPISLWCWLREKWTDPHRQRANVAEIITAFLTLVIIVVGVLQWTVYKQQKRIMEESSGQTDQLIEAAEIQALASRRIAAASRREAHAADRNAEAAEGFATSADQIRQETAKAVGELRRTSNATIEASQLNERPWLTPLNYKLSNEAISGKPFTYSIEVSIQNTGKTPAVDALPISATLEWPRDRETPPLDTSTPPKWLELIPPTQVSSAGGTGFSFPTGPKTVIDPTAYINGANDIYILGKFNYCDVYGVHHWTTFCAVHKYSTPLQAFGACIAPTVIDHNTKAGPPCHGN